MKGIKRGQLTTDDLLRRQEEPQAKKRRRASDTFPEEESSSSQHTGSDETEDDEEVSEAMEDRAGDDSGSEGEDEEINGRRKAYKADAMSAPSASYNDVATNPEATSSRMKMPTRAPIAHPLQKSAVSSFSSLGISPPLAAALTSMSIRTPTEVQVACIPHLLAGRDCVGNAKTGSGKTIAFALPILQKLSADPYGIFALVLTPTRELAFQISDQFSVLGGALNIQTAVIVGGMDMMAQALELNNRPHVVVATPGRIVDHMRSSSGEWDLSRVKFLVLDEADRLLTPTFAPELTHLFNALPKERQTCLFTATLTPSIESLIEAPPRAGKQKPYVHRMSAAVETVDTLKQHYILVPAHVREPYLYHLLCNPPESVCHLRRAPPEPTNHHKKTKPKKPQHKKSSTTAETDIPLQPPPTIIFCARAHTAAYLTHLLKTLSIRSTALHSRLTQRERLSSLSLFRSSVIPVLICTDVGARGLDIEDVAMVVNWDMPNEPEEYTHRVGRTARKGRGGVAVSFVTERDEERVMKIENRINTKLTEMTMSEEKVLEKLNTVATAKRLANMELHDSNFGKREEVHKIKRAKQHQAKDMKT